MKDCAIHHREPAMTPTHCIRCGEKIRYVTGIALCNDCLSDEAAEAKRYWLRIHEGEDPKTWAWPEEEPTITRAQVEEE